MARPTGRPVRDEILVAAQRLIQQVGVDGFSYADLAEIVDVRAPSIHHHFRRKEDLVAEVANRYRRSFRTTVAAIDDPSPRDRILAYAEIFSDTAAEQLLCLCGTLAGEWSTIGDRARQVVQAFVEDQLTWLAEQLEEAARVGEIADTADHRATAELILATLEGALLLSRTGRPPALAGEQCRALLDGLAPAG